MAIQANKPNNRIFLILGVVLAALAFGGVLFALRQAGGSTTSIVVAKTNLSAGTTITADEVTTAQETVAPPDAYTDPTKVVGQTLTASVSTNTALTPELFQSVALPAPSAAANGSSASQAPVSVETQITKGFVAMAIPAAGELPQGFTQLQQNNVSSELTSAGFYIQPGDHIDILVMDVANGQVFGTRFAFQDLPVLRVGNAGTAANAAVTTYTVEVARSQVELLAALTSGQAHEVVLRYVLRPQSEWGKLTPASYSPNYEPDTGPQPPKVADNVVTPGALDSLFGP